MIIPSHYDWLGTIGTLPRMVSTALDLYGTHEIGGTANNPTIIAWAAEVGVAAEYTADSIPWCGLFMAIVAKRSDYAPPTHPLWALNWATFGTQEHQPLLGDVLVFVRDGGGHVGLYIGEDSQAYHVLGGNTADAVQIARIDKSRLKTARAPAYKIGRPPSSKPYILASVGALSTNEA